MKESEEGTIEEVTVAGTPTNDPVVTRVNRVGHRGHVTMKTIAAETIIAEMTTDGMTTVAMTTAETTIAAKSLAIDVHITTSDVLVADHRAQIDITVIEDNG